MSWHVLVIDDDDVLRETLCSVLDARGYRVLSACNGRDAIDRVHARGARPAVVVLDLSMPVMDGEEFLRQQSSDPLLVAVPAVVMTANPSPPTDLAGDVRAIFQKPIRLAALLQTIQRVCGDVGALKVATATGTGAVARFRPVLVDPQPRSATTSQKLRRSTTDPGDATE
jgi:CheY-like chemotaxis protein